MNGPTLSNRHQPEDPSALDLTDRAGMYKFVAIILEEEARDSHEIHKCPDNRGRFEKLVDRAVDILMRCELPTPNQTEYSKIFLALNTAALTWLEELGEIPNPFMTNSWAGTLLGAVDNHPSLRSKRS